MQNRVFVIGLNGMPLMPTSPGKARSLLKERKAHVIRMNPFTIQLDCKTGVASQPLSVGIDTGESNIGIAVLQEDKVIYKAEIQLRKSMDKRKLMELRASLRRGRRYRKTRYRHPKWELHAVRRCFEKPDRKGRHWRTVKTATSSPRPDGWLPPSIQSKVNHHIFWISKIVNSIPDTARLMIEVARFDIQKIKNPDIEGTQYQQGRLYQEENVKAYVLTRFGYRCVVCGHAFDSGHKLRMHHIHMRKNGATDNPDEFAPVCHLCHTPENHKPGMPLHKLMKKLEAAEYREPTFMNILRRRLFEAFPGAEFTYGNVTTANRKALRLDKTHANDAVAIAAGFRFDSLHDVDRTIQFRQVRRKKRSLHEANPRKGRKKPNNEARRNRKNVKSVKGFSVWDTVEYNGRRGFISGFTGKAARIMDWDGNYIKPDGRSYSQIQLTELKLIQRRTNNYVQRAITNSSPSCRG